MVQRVVILRFPGAIVVWLLALIAAGAAHGQINPVYVDDSPMARQMFARAIDHADDNIGEAVRILQELLDEYPDRLITAGDGTPDRYVTVRMRVLETLRDKPPLLERYRQTETARARRMLEAGLDEQLARSRPLTAPGLEAMLVLAQRNLERGRFNAAVRWLDEAIIHADLIGRQATSIENERRAAHAWHMIGLAAAHQGQTWRVEQALEQLERLGHRADPLQEHLMRHRVVSPPARYGEGQGVFDRTLAAGLDELIAEEIWSLPMEDSLHRRRERNTATDRPVMGRSLQQSKEDGHFLTVAPTVRGNVVFINQGHRVSAFDRMSGSPMWERDYVDRPSVSVVDREDQQPRDLNAIVVKGDALVTMTGHASGTDRSSDGRIIRLSAETGKLVWSARLSDLTTADGEMDDLFPHSGPVIVDDSVIVLARRVSRQSLSSAYLVSYHLQSGEPQWIRHIVSSSSTRRASRAFSTLAVHDGDVYISSPIGAVARACAATGQMRWLHRFHVGINPHPIEQQQRPWEVLSPIVLDDRVVAVEPGFRRVVILDRSSGLVLRSIDAASRAGQRQDERVAEGQIGWQTPHYLLLGSRYIIAVGREIMAYDPDDLTQPVWRLPMAEGDDGNTVIHTSSHHLDGPQWSGTYEPYGRVQVARDMTAPADSASSWLIVPTRTSVYVVDEESGRVTVHLPIRSPGNVLASEAQLLVAGNDSLSAYMSLSRAEQLMRDRVARMPSDPAPALGLVRLGVRVGRFDLVMEAAELAAHAVDLAMSRGGRDARDAEDYRNELIGLLIDAEMDHLASDRDEAESLFTLLDRIVDTSEQRVAAILKRGDWYRQRDPGRAIETWQQVLAVRELGQVLWQEKRVRSLESGEKDAEAQTRSQVVPAKAGTAAHRPQPIIRPARSTAKQRIASIITEHGERVYEPQAEFVRMRFRSLSERSATPPERLMELVRQFPFAPAAVEAGIEAAERLAATGASDGVDRALDALAETYQETVVGYGLWAMRDGPGANGHEPQSIAQSPQPTALLQRYFELAIEHDRRAAAMDMLRYVAVRCQHSDDDCRLMSEGNAEEQGARSEETSSALGTRQSALLRLFADHSAQDGWRLTEGSPVRVGAVERWVDVLEGRLMRQARGARGGGDNGGGGLLMGPNDAALVVVDGDGEGWRGIAKIRLASDSPVEVWRQEIAAGADPRLVLWTDQQILIEYESPPARGGGVRVASLAAEDGQVQWVTEEPPEQPATQGGDGLGGAGLDGPTVRRQLDPMLGATRPSRPMSRESSDVSVVTLISRDHLVMVRADGMVAGYRWEMAGNAERADDDRAAAERRQERMRQPVWHVRGALDAVHHAVLQDGMVILVGARREMSGSGRSRMQPVMAMLDVRSGEHRIEPFTPPFAGEEIAWMKAISPGVAVYASDEGVTQIDVRRGDLLWSNHSYPLTQAPRAWLNGLHLLVEDRGGNLRRLDLDSGRMSATFEVPRHGDWEPLRLLDVHVDDAAFVVRYRQRFVRYDLEGSVIGADMILDERIDEWLMQAEDRFVLLSNLAEGAGERWPAHAEQTVYRMYMLSQSGRLLGEGVDLALPHLLQRIDNAALRDGWLLATAGDWTIALPMPAE